MSTFLTIVSAFYVISFLLMLYCYLFAERVPSDDEKF